MASPNSARILEVSHVAPFTDSSKSDAEFSLPLTFFDTYWIGHPPVQRLFFYSLRETKDYFFYSLLPKLKHSLSLTLQYFLPLAGKLTWPHDYPKPIVLYIPGDAVSVSIAESNADFNLLTANHGCQASAVRPLVPLLHVSETGASVIALQITVFPDRGFCIGLTTHHVVLDGKSSTMFLKSWAYLSKENLPLSPVLMPFYDRTVIKDQCGFDMKFLSKWLRNHAATSSDSRNNPKMFELVQFRSPDELSDLYRATFELSHSDIDKLRQRVSSNWDSLTHISPKPKLHLTSFVLTYAYMLDCILKATEGDESKRRVCLAFACDYRNRLRPPVPENYLGNCVGGKANFDLREQLAGREEDSLTTLVFKISGLVKELGEEDNLEKEMEKRFCKSKSNAFEKTLVVGVAGSPRLGIYSIDFGWGRPKKVDVISIGNGSISMAESRDGTGGIEVGLVLEKHQMDLFASAFVTGLGSIL